MKVTMKLEGMEQLQAAILRAHALVKAQSAAVAKTTTNAVAQRMRGTVPKDTGTLQRAIAASSAGVTIDDSASYWRHVEFGTVRMAARPFARPAAEAERSQVEQRTRAVGTALERDWSGR